MFFQRGKQMNNARACAEPDPGLLEPALQWSTRFIFDHAWRERFWSKGKVVAQPSSAADKFDVASKRIRSQIQSVVEEKPTRRHVWALPQIERVRQADRIHKIVFIAQEYRLDIGLDYFDMANRKSQASFILFRNL